MAGVRPAVVAGAAAATAALVLVDYDNAFRLGRDEPTSAEVRHELVAVLREVVARSPDTDTFHIRLYGGWHEDGELTSLGSRVAQVVEEASLFPLVDGVRKRVLRGSVELVDRLLALPEISLANTYRRRAGLPRVRLASRPCPSGCVQDAAHCPVLTLHRFVRRKGSMCGVESCTVTSDAAFSAYEQKMVDTLLACDLLQAEKTSKGPLVVVTSDVDFVPALVLAAAGGSGRVFVRDQLGRWDDPTRSLLAATGVAILEEEFE